MQSTTTTATRCTGCQSTGDCCCEGTLERPRFFPRQLVTPAELNLASAYVLERMRLHNRLLHGWGVICGAQVCRVAGSDGSAQPWKVKIRPGHLIDGCGNDVTIDCDRIVDLRAAGTVVAGGDPSGEIRDPWCSDVWTDSDGGRIWLAVCYKQIAARPVRTQPTGCGCDDTSCEYSRWVDGYEVRRLDECPPSHRGAPPSLDDLRATLSGPLPDCSPCPDDPCVVLAAIDVDADGTITAIDNCSCRRMVASTAAFWWRCGGVVTINAVTVTPDGAITPGMTGEVKVTGDNLHDDLTVDLGSGVQVGTATIDSAGALIVPFTIGEDAKAGDRTVTISTKDCSMATWENALTVSDLAVNRVRVPKPAPDDAKPAPAAPAAAAPAPAAAARSRRSPRVAPADKPASGDVEPKPKPVSKPSRSRRPPRS
jgi:hypothetical protein